jgi:hypothetical protein
MIGGKEGLTSQPAANLLNPFATHAELPRAPAGIAHRQNEYPMALAARTLGAAAAVPYVRCRSEPRRSSPVIGSSPRSRARARYRLIITHRNQ